MTAPATSGGGVVPGPGPGQVWHRDPDLHEQLILALADGTPLTRAAALLSLSTSDAKNTARAFGWPDVRAVRSAALDIVNDLAQPLGDTQIMATPATHPAPPVHSGSILDNAERRDPADQAILDDTVEVLQVLDQACHRILGLALQDLEAAARGRAAAIVVARSVVAHGTVGEVLAVAEFIAYGRSS